MQTAQALLAFALALSIPIVLFGSSLVVRLLERYPRASWLGALALIKTAAEMILDEPATGARAAPPRAAPFERAAPPPYTDAALRGFRGQKGPKLS